MATLGQARGSQPMAPLPLGLTVRMDKRDTDN